MVRSTGDDNHDLVSKGCYLDIWAPDGVCIVFGSWGCDHVRTTFFALTPPYYGWPKEPLHGMLGGTGLRLAPIRVRMSAS